MDRRTPPRRRKPKPAQAPPPASAAEKPKLTTEQRLDGMKKWATETVMPKLKELEAQLSKVNAMLIVGLFDPEALAQLSLDIHGSERALSEASGALRGSGIKLAELDGKRKDLLKQVDTVSRPIRAEENGYDADGKKKHPNLDAVADAVAERLATNDDYQAIMNSLDDVDMDIALLKGERQDCERTLKNTGKILASQQARLENLTARIYYSTNRGGKHE